MLFAVNYAVRALQPGVDFLISQNMAPKRERRREFLQRLPEPGKPA